MGFIFGNARGKGGGANAWLGCVFLLEDEVETFFCFLSF
jgi:hypothetical protein